MTHGRADSPRIGCVRYLNAQPLIHGWPGAVDFDHPAILCRKLADAELDIALVSSFEYLRNPIYAIVDEVAVAADGAVFSAFVAHSGLIEAVEEIELDSASLTSVNLLRCLLFERGSEVRLLPATPDSSIEITRTRARLLIGDQAIRFRQRYGERYQYWDLAAEWKRATGWPFVFALWLIRPEVADASIIAASLRTRRDQNLSNLEQVIAAQLEFSAEFCAHYFRDCLRFSFAEAEKKGLLLFRALCEKHEILPPNSTPLRLV